MELNHVIPRYQRGAVTVWLLPLVGCVDAWELHLPPRSRRGRSRTSGPLPVVQVRCRCATRRWWSRECSNLPLPGFNRPLHRQSFGTVVLAREPDDRRTALSGGSLGDSEGTPDLRRGRAAPSCVPDERQVFLRNAGRSCEPAAGIEPAPSRVRAERPPFRTSPAWPGSTGVHLQHLSLQMNAECHRLEWTEGFEPSPSAWGADVLPLTPRPPGLGRSPVLAFDFRCIPVKERQFAGPARPSPGGTLRRAALRCPCSSGPGAACGGPRPGRTGRP